jgi:hypothetical protein
MKLLPRGFRLPRYEILIVAGVALLAFIITLSVMASSVGARSRRRAQEARQELERPRTPPVLSADDLALTPDDFLLPQAPSMNTDIPYVPFRPRLDRWPAEIAGKYWIPPRDIAIDVLRAVNDENMKRLLQGVP